MHVRQGECDPEEAIMAPVSGAALRPSGRVHVGRRSSDQNK
jgi:hypothetical protein